VGLGAFTSVAGDQGKTVATRANIAVTTGGSYTTATAIEGALRGAELMGIDPTNARVAVVGATGSIGKTCACMLAKTVSTVTLVGRSKDRLDVVAAEISPGAKATGSQP